MRLYTVDPPTPGVPGDYVLPDGAAKTLIQQNCTICHNLRNIVNSNKSADDWENTVNMMRSAGSVTARAYDCASPQLLRGRVRHKG